MSGEDGTPFVAKIGKQGKITLPKNVRELHGLRGGDVVICTFNRKAGPAKALFDALPIVKDGPPTDAADTGGDNP